MPIEGTIAWVKDQDDSTSVSLTGKVVTAVFHNPTDFFYIEEADGSSGIKVDPPSGTIVDSGDVVSVDGQAGRTDNGSCDIANASRPAKPKEYGTAKTRNARLVATRLAKDGLAIVVNASNKVRILSISRKQNEPGIVPSERNVANETYPLFRFLPAYTMGKPKGLAGDFLKWCAGPQGQAMVKESGYLPLE